MSNKAIAEFLYSEGATFFFKIEEDVYGFVPDSGLVEGKFLTVLEVASHNGEIPVSFLIRNSVLISQPAGAAPGQLFTEAFSRLTASEKTNNQSSSIGREFLAGYRLGYDRGYNDGGTLDVVANEDTRVEDE